MPPRTSSGSHRRKSPAAESGGPAGGSRDKLLRSAEALFSAKGFREVSVREIASHAGVNYALVAYYFRGKQALFDEVFRAHTDPLMREGLTRLQAITLHGREPSVEEILKAWLLPLLQLKDSREPGAVHLRVTAHLSNERWARSRKVSGSMRRSHDAFLQALRSRLPHLSEETITWRLHFVMGALVFGIRHPASLTALSGGRCNPDDLEAVFEQILPYAVAGFHAPETAGSQGRKPARRPAGRKDSIA